MIRGLAGSARRAAVAVGRVSDAVARIEAALAGALALAVCGLILLNIATRSFGAALYWVDEAAIYCMVWSAFLAASVTIHRRSAIALPLLRDALPARGDRAISRLVDAVTLGFGLALLTLVWRWYDPITLARAGFDGRVLAAETFNFIYREPTLTIGVAKWPVWLIMPIFAVGLSLHALANLLEQVEIGAVRGAAPLGVD